MYMHRAKTLLVAVSAAMFTFASSCRPGEYECKSFRKKWSCLSQSELCDGNPNCHWKDDEKNCDVIPEVIVSCRGNYPKDGYYKGKSATCTCDVKTRDKEIHKGFAQWLKDESAESEPLKSITLISNNSKANQGYRCSGQSGFGKQDRGVAMEPKFAYLDQDTVMLSPTLLTICSSDSNSRQVTCQVPKKSVNPAPQFSFYGDGKLLGEPLTAIETDSHYQQVLSVPGPSGGGVMEISCHVTNTVFDDLEQKISKSVTLRQPPAQPPMVTILGQTFQGVSPINVAVLPQNFTGALTCKVSGGFPQARIGSLACGENIGYSEDTAGTVRFQNAEVTHSMHEVYCSCIAEHDSGCYGNSETRVQVKVLFPRSKNSDGQSGNQNGNQDGNQGGKQDGKQGGKQDESQNGNRELVTPIIAVLLAILVILLIIVIVILVLRQRRQSQEEGSKRERMQLNEQKA